MQRLRGGQSLLTVLIMFSMIVAGSSIVATVVQGPNASQQGAKAAEDDDPLAAARYLASLRQGPQGTSPARARQDALAQAQKLPAAKSVPVAKNGKGTKVAPGKELAAPFGQWNQLGPAPMNHGTLNPSADYVGGIDSGRATSVVVGPNSGIIYLGTAGGGVWKSTDGGTNWTALTDNQPSLAIGSLALDPSDPTDRTLYAGTGEANYDIYQSDKTYYQGDNYLGIGVLKTTDGGATWTLLGQNVFGSHYGASSVGIGALVANGNTVLAGTTNGLYKWDSSGTNFNQVTVASSNVNARVTDLVMDGANVYVVLSGANAGLAVAGVYKSTTGGGSGYNPMMSGLPDGTTWTRAQLAIARSSPQTLYLTIADKNWDLLSPNGIFKTTNGGGAWSPTSQPPNYLDVSNAQGFYDNVIAVDPANANLVYAGGVNIISSANGGGSWTTIGNPYCNGGALPCTSNIHADNHAMAFGSSGTPRPLYVAGDGGLYQSFGSGATVSWTSLNQHIATAQFYTGDASQNFLNAGIVAGAAQDNGVSRSASGNGYGTWNGISGGDGTYVGISKQNPNNGYTALPNGKLRRMANMNQTGSGLTITDGVGVSTLCDDTNASPLFVPPFALDPVNDQHLLFGGGGRVCETVDGAANWSKDTISLGSAVQSLAFAANSSTIVYAGTTNGKVWRTTNANQHPANAATWTACAASGLPAQPVTGLATDPTDSTTIYATLAGFGNSHVYKVTDCTNASKSWTALSGSGGTNPLPDAPVMSVVVYAGASGPVIVVGGDVGVFVSEDNGANWFNLHSQLPASVPIMKVFTDVAETTLFAATHGRGMWEIPIPASSEAGISFSQSPVAFGDVTIGSSGNQTLTMTNSGTAPIVFGQIAFSNPPSITEGADTCSNKTIAPSGQCSIAFTFTPTLPGTTAGQLTVNDNLAGAPQFVTVGGTGTGGGTATFNPASFGYGNRAVNTDNLQTFEIHNTGVGDLTVSGIGMTPNSGSYSVSADGCTSQVVPAGQSCFINVNFRPTSSQSYYATLDFTDDAPSPGSQQHVQMSGFGISAIKFSPGDIDFGSSDINTSGTSPHPLTVSNVSGNAITFGPADVVSSGDFVIADDTCNGNTISAGNSCLVDVQFHPLSVGSKSGRITVHVGSAETPFMSLEGFGTNGAAPAVSVNPNPIAFGDTPFDPNTVGVYRNYQYVVLQNSGASPMQNISVSVDTNAPDDHADFGIDSSPCDGGGLVLQPGEACRMYVHFIPQNLTAGARSATLLIASNATPPGSPARIPMTGNAVTAASTQKALIGVTALTPFGNQPVSTSSAMLNVNIKSWGNRGFAVDTIAMAADSPNAGDFALNGEFACEMSYGPDVVGRPPPSCDVGVSFTPTGTGLRQAYVDITFLNNGSPPVRMYLTGTGTAPAVTLDTTTLDFTAAIGATVQKDATITNSGTAPLVISGMQSTGPHFGPYYPSTTGNNCGTIQPAASCHFQINFTAYSTTVEQADINIYTNVRTDPYAIHVTGRTPPAVITVTTTQDVINPTDGLCSLREAIIAVNTAASGTAAGECPVGAAGSTITLANGATYTLTIAPTVSSQDPTKGDLDVTADMNIVVAGNGTATIDAGLIDRVMTIGTSQTTCSPTVNITGVTMTHGQTRLTSYGHSGGGLDIFCGTVTLLDSSVTNSGSISNGGGIEAQGGILTLNRVTVSGNTAAGSGGGIYHTSNIAGTNPPITLTMNLNTISGNTAQNGTGGGIYQAGPAQVAVSTISGNTAQAGGGAIDSHAELSIGASTIARNSTGVRNNQSYPVFVQTTILANIGANCTVTSTGPFYSFGYNLDSGATCAFNGTGDLANTDPNLDPTLAKNGGTTQTHALLASSPAIDRVPTSQALCQGTTDQRGVARPFGPACDIGAYEYNVVIPPSPTPGQKPPGNIDPNKPAPAPPRDPTGPIDPNKPNPLPMAPGPPVGQPVTGQPAPVPSGRP